MVSAMRNKIVAGGYARFLRGQRRAAVESAEERYAAELAKAGPAERIQIRERMAEACRRLARTAGHKPSPGTLW